MTALALALALAAQAPATATPSTWWTSGGRLVTTPTLHVGVRGHCFIDNEGDGGRLEVGVGATVQISWLGTL